MRLATLTIRGAAHPNAVLACILGGRIPQSNERLPIYFYDLVRAGTRTVLVSQISNGSERTLLNYFALTSLGGCVVFACWTLQEALAVGFFVVESYRDRRINQHTRQQLVYGVAQWNVATRVWRRRRPYMVIFGFISILSWHIGATGTGCGWQTAIEAPGERPLAVSYNYVCSPGVVTGYFTSWRELLRLQAFSHVFYNIVFQDRAFGIERLTFGIALSSFFLGLLPSLTTSMVVVQLNAVRLLVPGLGLVHNHVVLMLLWLWAIAAWRNVLGGPYRQCIDWLLARLGFSRQRVEEDNVAFYLIGEHYYAWHTEVHAEPTAWLPLSVILESARAEVECVDVIRRQYHLKASRACYRASAAVQTSQRKQSMTKPTRQAGWAHDISESVFFCGKAFDHRPEFRRQGLWPTVQALARTPHTTRRVAVAPTAATHFHTGGVVPDSGAGASPMRASDDANKAIPPPGHSHVRRSLSAASFVLGVLWNVFTPVRLWAVADPRVVTDGVFQFDLVNWTTALDAVFIDKLYAAAGTPLDYPGAANRFVNVLIDLMVSARSTNWYQPLERQSEIVDPSVTLPYCRMQMRASPPKSALELASIADTMLTTALFVDADDCAIAAVPEALLCVVGANASVLLPSSFDLAHQSLIQTWQAAV